MSFTTTGFSKHKSEKYFKKQGMVFIPSGSITVNTERKSMQAFYMQKSEVTNAQYRLFLNDLRAKGKKDELAIANIDSSQWRSAMAYCEPFVEYYAWHPAYDNYPVVNISQDAARLYCAWLTDKYRSEGYMVTVRLPFEAEWIYAAKSGVDTRSYAWDGAFTRNKKGLILANYKADSNYIEALGNDLLAPVISFFSNDFGLYNMCGNAAEWINEPGRTKGGSWANTAEQIKVDAGDTYAGNTAASPFIGFRVVFIYGSD